MPIQILDYPDPLSPASRTSTSEPVLIKSEAYYQLLHEMRRYCNSQIKGRSFLIAGHRGAGKTTLVLSVFEKIQRDSKAGQLGARPILVQLLGPSLLPDPNENEQIQLKNDAAHGELKLTEFENVLVQFTLALYRAVVREFETSYQDRMAQLAAPPWERRRSDSEKAASCLEVPGQLALELDEYPGKARLRDFWRRARALPSGLLSRGVSAAAIPVDQGVRELIALCSVSEAYRRISGTIQAKKEDKSAGQDSEAQTTEREFKGKELLGPLITLLTGGAVATGVAAFDPKHVQFAVLAGLLTALASAFVAKRSTSRSQQRSAFQEDLFLPNLSVATLDRVLPVLLERVRDAGLAPVFVIDELDKVEDLSDRIPQMIKRLKKLVAEDAFFCFLTDRRYFEEMRARSRATPYSLEYTYFTHTVFVTHRHTDLHSYLSQLLKKPELPTSSGAWTELTKGQSSIDEEIAEEIADHALLPFVLLHAAQMHPIDLIRQVAEVRGADGALSNELGSVRSNVGRRNQLLVQVAIEALLEEGPMQLELVGDSSFRRLAHDALYFLSENWKLGVRELRFDSKARAEFEKFLIKRMKTDGRGVSRDEPLRASFTPQQAEFLWNNVQRLADLLEDPIKIRNMAILTPRHFPSQVIDALKELDPLLRRRVDGRTEVFHWRYNRAGIPYPEEEGAIREAPVSAATVDVPTESRAKPVTTPVGDMELIGRFNDALSQLTATTVNCGTLGAGFGLISTSPAWPAVQRSIERLRTISGDYLQRNDDVYVVNQFADLLERSATTIGFGIVCGLALGSLDPATLEETPTTQSLVSATGKEGISAPRRNAIFDGLETLSSALGLKALHEEKVMARINEFAKEVFERLHVNGRLVLSLPNAAAVADWKGDLENLIEQAKTGLAKLDLSDSTIEDKAWKFWRQRLLGGDVSPDFDTTVCAVKRRGPSRFLKFALEQMPARAWSEAFYAAVIANPKPNPELAGSIDDLGSAPSWLALVALQRLGFDLGQQAQVEISALLFGYIVAVDILKLAGSNVPFPGSTIKRSLSIISKENAESEKWTPAKECAAIVLRANEIDRLRKLLGIDDQETLFRRLGFEWLVVDWSVRPRASKRSAHSRTADYPVEDPAEVDAVLSVAKSFSGYLPSGFRVFTIVPPDWTRSLPAPFWPVSLPGSLDELFTILSREGAKSIPS